MSNSVTESTAINRHCTKLKYSIKEFFSKSEQILSFIFCQVTVGLIYTISQFQTLYFHRNNKGFTQKNLFVKKKEKKCKKNNSNFHVHIPPGYIMKIEGA